MFPFVPEKIISSLIDHQQNEIIAALTEPPFSLFEVLTDVPRQTPQIRQAKSKLQHPQCLQC